MSILPRRNCDCPCEAEDRFCTTTFDILWHNLRIAVYTNQSSSRFPVFHARMSSSLALDAVGRNCEYNRCCPDDLSSARSDECAVTSSYTPRWMKEVPDLWRKFSPGSIELSRSAWVRNVRDTAIKGSLCCGYDLPVCLCLIILRVSLGLGYLELCGQVRQVHQRAGLQFSKNWEYLRALNISLQMFWNFPIVRCQTSVSKLYLITQRFWDV